MIERINILYGFLKNGECVKVKEMIDDIYSKLSIKSYAESYTIVLFVEAVRKMNREIRGFFYDEIELIQKMTDSAPSVVAEEVTRDICARLKTSRVHSDEAMLKKAVGFIEKNYGDPQLSAAMVADITGIPQPRLTELFNKGCGIGIGGYINRFRVNITMPLLLDEDFTVNEIAEKAGFGTVQAYMRAFKKMYRVTPGRYREMMTSRD